MIRLTFHFNKPNLDHFESGPPRDLLTQHCEFTIQSYSRQNRISYNTFFQDNKITGVWMRELDYKESWAPKNWCFWIVVLEKTLDSPLDSKKVKPVNHIGYPPWIFIGRTDAEIEAPILCHLIWRASSMDKTPLLGKIEGRRRRGWQRMVWLDDIITPMDISFNKL